MNWKGCGRRLSWPNLRYYPSIFLEDLWKTTKILNRDSRFPGRDRDLSNTKQECQPHDHNVRFAGCLGCSKSHATHGEMQYKCYFFIIMPISYNKCWKCSPLLSSQRCTRRIMLANTFCNVPVDILSTVSWVLAWSSCSVCGWFEYTVSLRCPHKNKSGGLVRRSWRPQSLWNEASRKHRFQVSHGLRDFLNIL
jgi:hypothetical protein